MEISRYTRPKTLDEAYTLIRENGGFPLGGGAWVHMNMRKVDLAVDLCALDLRYIAERGDTIEIGAMATARDLEISPLLKDVFGELFRNATEHLVGVQLRNVITIGGTVAGKYGFSDIITVLAALDASLVMYKDKPVDIISFLTTARDEPYLLEKIVVDKNVRASFQSVRVTKNDFAILNACAARAGDAWRVAVGGRPAAARLSEKAAAVLDGNPSPSGDLVGRAAQAAASELSFGSDTRGSEEYRRIVCETLVRRAIAEASK